MKTQKFQWLPFYKLLRGEGLFLGGSRAQKANTFFAWKGGIRVFVAPWRRVRTVRPYGPLASRIVGDIAQVRAVKAPYLAIVTARTEPVEGDGNTEQRPLE